MKKGKIFEGVRLQKFVHGGQAMGELEDGRKVLVWGGLPGELVNVRITKKKKSYLEGVVEQVIEPSEDRIDPEEPESYLSTSPWQTMTFEAENRHKQSVLAETFEREGVDVAWSEFAHTEQQYGYRNKIEIGFWGDDDGLHLAHFRRGSHGKQIVTENKLADEAINKAARAMRDELNRLGVWAGDLKTLVLRSSRSSAKPRDHASKHRPTRAEPSSQSYSAGYDPSTLNSSSARQEYADHDSEAASNFENKVVGALFVKKRLNLDNFKMPSELTGVDIYFSNPQSPASVPNDRLYSFGDITLTDTISEQDIMYDVLSFFQVNLPIFEHALTDIRHHLPVKNPTRDKIFHGGMKVVDMYSGVGTIGLAVGADVLVESDDACVRMANINTKTPRNNHIQAWPVYGGGGRVVHAASEEALEYITSDAVVIVDPPRAGLHADVVERILKEKPPLVMYLSCNPATQARDVQLLKQHYDIQFARGYNFFPRTPHIESLIVLKRQ